MTKALFFIVALIFCVAAHEGHDHDHDHPEIDESAVVVLGTDNFDETIEKNEFVFVEFYAPWCGHCKHLAPEYAQAAKTLKDEGSNVVVAKVDATQHEALGKKFDIKGYPTLKFFRNQVPSDYDGGRTAQDIVAFIRRKSGPSSKPLASAAELNSFTASLGTQLVAYLSSSDSDGTQTWIDACKTAQFEDFGCGHITDAALFGGKVAPTISIFRDGEDEIHYSGEFSKDAIVQWASTEGHPLFAELAQQIWQRSQNSKTPLVALFYPQINDDAKAQARVLGGKFKGKASVSYSGTVAIAERWGASGKKLPTAILVKWTDEGAKFVIFNEDTEEFTTESAEIFIAAGLAGTYKGFSKSEPIPENNNGPVKTVVGKNFDALVLDETKDVFVEFYAPWCGHCKKLTPIWEELGTAFQKYPSIVIGKMDATANTVPEKFEVRGFPTLIFFPRNNKSGVTYSGERDLPSLTKFVQDNASEQVGKDEL